MCKKFSFSVFTWYRGLYRSCKDTTLIEHSSVFRLFFYLAKSDWAIETLSFGSSFVLGRVFGSLALSWFSSLSTSLVSSCKEVQYLLCMGTDFACSLLIAGTASAFKHAQSPAMPVFAVTANLSPKHCFSWRNVILSVAVLVWCTVSLQCLSGVLVVVYTHRNAVFRKSTIVY